MQFVQNNPKLHIFIEQNAKIWYFLHKILWNKFIGGTNVKTKTFFDFKTQKC